MKRLASYSFVLVSLLIGISILSTVTLGQSDWRQIPIRPLRAFQPKQPKRIQLPNGMVIFLQEDRELPLIDVMRSPSNPPVQDSAAASVAARICR